MPTKPAALTRDEFALALHRLNPLYAYRWTSATEYEWRGLQNPDGTYDGTAPVPTDQQLTDAWAAAQADPVSPIGKEAERTTAQTDLLDQYQTAYDRLTAVIDDDTVTDTAAEMRAEFRFAARVLRRLLREAKARLA